MPKGFLDRVNVSTVAINGISGLGLALLALYAPLEKLKLPQPYTSYVLGAIAVVFVFIVLRAAIIAVPVRSVLRDPDAFVLRRESPEHLVGRTEDIKHLEDKLNEVSLLFVVGESGVGKSALLRAGLAPKLKAGHRYLPVYIESVAGSDWAEGPWRAVLPAFRAALSDKAAPPSRKPFAEAFGELLEAARKAGRVPVLILDQFDDYQLRHRALFIRAGTWLRPAELVAENPFWAVLRAALEGSQLQLVIATRDNMALGLEAVRFIDPLPYPVDKVAPQYLRDLIERLSGTSSGASGAIDAPLATWPDLRTRLIDDLVSGGAILPQQLKVALLGLQGLPRQQLTTAAFVAVGGVRGLEANWIEMQIGRTVRRSKLSSSDILHLLVALCEPDAVAKTRDLSLRALCELAGLTDQAAVETALTALEEGEVVRRLARVDLNESLWRLDHDYIAGVVDLANRRANRWELTLAEGRKTLAAASGVVQKWEALLPLKTQIQFFLDRAKSRFHYSSSRAYALISLARFAPVMLAVLLVALGYHSIQTNTRNRELAARVSAGFDTEERLSEKEIKNLSDLSLSNMSVARGVIKLMLDDSNLADNFVTHRRAVMAALDLAAEGDWAALSETAERFAEKARGSEEIPKIYVAAMLLDRADRTSKATTLLINAMVTHKNDTDALARLADGLGSIGSRVPQEKAGLAANHVVAAMEANKDNVEVLFSLIGGLAAIADRVPQKTVGLAATFLVASALKPEEYEAYSLFRMADAVDAIADRIPQETAGHLAARLVAAMEANKDGLRSDSGHSAALGVIADRISQESAGHLATRLVTAMVANKGDEDVFSQFADGLRVIVDRVPQETAHQLADRIVAAMKTNKDDDRALPLLASGLGHIGDRVPQKTAGLAVSLVVAAMEANKGSPFKLSRLAGGLGAIGKHVPEGKAGQAATFLIAAMKANMHKPRELFLVPGGLHSIGNRMPQETADLAATAVVAAMQAYNGHVDALCYLYDGLGAIWNRVPQETADLAVTLLVAAMQANKSDVQSLSALAYALGAGADRVPREKAGLVATLLVAGIETNKSRAVGLANGLRAIAHRVPEKTAGQLATRLITGMEARKDDADALSELAAGLAAIEDQVPKVDAQRLSSRLDTLLPQCETVSKCHVTRIGLHGILSRERAIQLAFLAARDPLVDDWSSTIIQRIGHLTGSEFKETEDWDAAEAWLRKHRAAAGVDDASIRKELRDLMRKRQAISNAKATSEATRL
ncbi:ATP-binding protein [Pseudoduganella albidiflava]|uniref:ATP-binding protein n=2 Tax=Pseudoduganella TaxID=1522432 RepID=A0A411WZF0_9BURK|nr:ATP-binding protein [Pseudoduganella albidiflava]QBI02082.1 ATP-binding protein [Pseudoduganella albidiflava]GGY65435.1 hypothetical protein GCM10007387_54690 [Pseudoduganella albidiflava]